MCRRIPVRRVCAEFTGWAVSETEIAFRINQRIAATDIVVERGEEAVFYPISLPVLRQAGLEHFEVKRHNRDFNSLLIDVHAMYAVSEQGGTEVGSEIPAALIILKSKFRFLFTAFRVFGQCGNRRLGQRRIGVDGGQAVIEQVLKCRDEKGA